MSGVGKYVRAYAYLLLILLVAPCRASESKEMIVGVHTNNSYSIVLPENSASIELPELQSIILKRYKRFGEFPFTIKPEKGTTFKEAWTVIETASRRGIWRQGLAIGDVTCMVSIPARDGSTTSLSPVMMKGFVGNGMVDDNGLLIRLAKGIIALNSRKISFKETERQMTRLSKLTKELTTLIIARDDTPMTELGDILLLLNRIGMKHVSLAREIKSQEVLALESLNKQIREFNANRMPNMGLQPLSERVTRVVYDSKQDQVSCYIKLGELFLVMKREKDGRFKGVKEVPYHQAAFSGPDGSHSWGHVKAEFYLDKDVFPDSADRLKELE